MGGMFRGWGLTDRCFQVVVGCAGREARVFPGAAQGEMVKALEGVVREACLRAPHRQAHQFMRGIVEETAADAASLRRLPSAPANDILPA
jgi:hypothetical protein